MKLYKNKIIQKAIYLLSSAVLVVSCNVDCGLVTTTYPCRVRETTIPQFDPRLNLVNGKVEVVPTYNNQTFEFPSDNSSSGRLANDNRYESSNINNQYYVVDQLIYTYPITNEAWTVQLVNLFPPNSDMTGDLMVVSVNADSIMPTALIRFAGKLSKFNEFFMFEDAQKFCSNYLPDYRVNYNDDEYKKMADASTQYGQGVKPNPGTVYADNIRILNSVRKDITNDTIDANRTALEILPQNVKNDILSKTNINGIDVPVNLGEVYYYKAVNGKIFAFIVANIFEGALDPKIKRVTIRFSELLGQGVNECQP